MEAEFQKKIFIIFSSGFTEAPLRLPGVPVLRPPAKAIVEEQGGSLTVSSQEGQGSVFVLSFSYVTEL